MTVCLNSISLNKRVTEVVLKCTVLLYAGKSGWPLIGVVGLITELGSGKTGKESYIHKIHEKYGPAVRLKGAGELSLKLRASHKLSIY